MWTGRLTVMLAVGLSSAAVFGQSGSPADAYYHFSLAKLHHVNQEYPQAIAEFEKAVVLDSASPSLRTEFALTLLRAGEAGRAIDQAEQAIGIDSDFVKAYLVLGQAHLGIRGPESLPKALKAFGQALEVDPDNGEALDFLGRIHFAQRDYEQAAEAFTRLVDVDPAHVRGYFSLGQSLRELGRYSEAIEALERGLRIRSDIPEYVLLLAETYEANGQTDKAIPLYELAYSLEPDEELGQHLARLKLEGGRASEAVTLLEGLIGDNPTSVRLRIELGRALKLERRYEAAIEILDKVVEESPANLEANFELAVVLGLVGERGRAAERFEFLLEKTEPGTFQKHVKLNLALVYQESHRFDDALPLLRELAAGAPEDLDAKLRLFYTFQESKRYSGASEISQQLRKEHPQSPYTAIAEAQVLVNGGRLEAAIEKLRAELDPEEEGDLLYGELSRLYMDAGRFEAAQGVIEEALAGDPDSFRMRYLMGAVLERRKEYALAEAQFQRLLEINPDDSDTLNYLGYMLADRGVRLTEALKYLERAVALDPYNGAYLDSLGWVYFKLDRLADAEKNLIKANRINSFDPVILEHLGDLYRRLGDREQARGYYEQSVSVAEEEEEMARVRGKLQELTGLLKR